MSNQQIINAVVARLQGGDAFQSDATTAAAGKVIVSVQIDNDELHVCLEPGQRLRIVDNGQSCCEHRYMTCDDKLSEYTGAVFYSVIVKDAVVEENGNVHETQFLEVVTSLGSFTLASHNEHNGYYGGFSIEAYLENL